MRRREPLEGLFNDKGGNALGPGIGIGFGIDDQRMGIRPVGDPHLVAIEDATIALFLGLKLHRDNVGSSARLAHRQRPDMFATDQFGQVFGLLFGRGVAFDLVDAQVGMRAIGQRDRGRSTADFFHGDHVLKIAKAGTAVFFGHCHAQQAKITEFAPEIVGELVTGINLGRARGDFGLGKRRDGFADCIRGFAKIEFQSGEVEKCHVPVPALRILVI